MVKVSFVSTVSILTPRQVRQKIRSLFGAERDSCACEWTRRSVGALALSNSDRARPGAETHDDDDICGISRPGPAVLVPARSRRAPPCRSMHGL